MSVNEIGATLDRTVASLGGGIRQLGVEAALPEITGWEERLAASGDPELASVAGTLADLRVQMQGGGFDPVTVGALLMSLGAQTAQVADAGVGSQVADRLSRLASLLGEEGNALTDRMMKG